MSGRARRIALALVLLALLLVAGRWGVSFLAERLWERSVSEAVAAAGARRALAAAGLELLVIAVAAGWLALHFGLAARLALPLRRPVHLPETRTWPPAIPRWSVPVAALVAGVLLGGGAGSSLDSLRLALDGFRFGVQDPYSDEDLAVFLGSFPLWTGLANRALGISLAALGGALALHAAGGTIRRYAHRFRVARRARGQFAVLLAVLALVLAWDASLEPLRLAAGARGPILQSEFVLRTLLAYLVTGFGALAAVMSLLWWLWVRGSVVFLFWMMFALARIGSMLLPLHAGSATTDPDWRATARGLDSVAFRLAQREVHGGRDPFPRAPLVLLVPSLWDDSVASRALGVPSGVHRGWIGGLIGPRPVWLGVNDPGGRSPAVVAISDDQVASTGAPLSWDGAAGVPVPGIRVYRELPGASLAVRPGAPRIVLAPGAPIRPAPDSAPVVIRSWRDRLVLAWAWQAGDLLSAPRGTRVGWRLDPAVRLRAVAPFAHWSKPRLRLLETGPVWQSDGLLVAARFPSSRLVAWTGETGSAAMLRTAFMGTVDAGTGRVRIFRRDPADSLSAVWARVAAPLIEPSERIPPPLRSGEAYPEELALAQARVLSGPAWSVGSLEPAGSDGILPPESPGGGEWVIPFNRPGARTVIALLLIRRAAGGDSLRLLRFDTAAAPPIEPASTLRQRWDRFPFQQLLRDSVLAAGAVFRTGAVRFALAAEGVVAYQPAWSETPGRRPRLALVNVALGQRLGTGRIMAEAWKNLHGELSPAPVGAGAQAVLDEVRRWWLHADSALKRGDLAELARALSYLREILERKP